jgi:hypothetical protein
MYVFADTSFSNQCAADGLKRNDVAHNLPTTEIILRATYLSARLRACVSSVRP